jgi:catechol 2,3-dioxygenase-like lactoylglutathione lyase family enzyme
MTNERENPMIHFHHAHLFANDLEATIEWYVKALGAEVFYNGDFGGARNAFLRVGEGRLHLYDQRPRDLGKGAVHHLGFRTNDLAALHRRLADMGTPFRSGIREFGSWRYIMCAAPDDVLLELFQIDLEKMPPQIARFFDDRTAT